MKTSESISNIAPAIVQIQAEAKDTFKSKKGHNYTYSPIDEVLKLVRPVATKNGVAILQSETQVDGLMIMETMLLHDSGEFISGTVCSPFEKLGSMNGYQSAGSGLTYLRRYGLSSILGIASDEDKDAHGETQEVRPEYKTVSKSTDKEKLQYKAQFMNACEAYGIDRGNITDFFNFCDPTINEDEKLKGNTIVQFLRSGDYFMEQVEAYLGWKAKQNA